MAKILIVDDDAADRELVRRALERTKATFIEAENGAQALDVARREHPDLIILDILMPVMSGEEALSFIRSDEALRGIRVLVASAVAERSRVMRVIECQPDAYILKPFDPLALRTKVTRLLERGPAATGESELSGGESCVAVAHGRSEIRASLLQAFRPFGLTLLETESGPGLLDLAHRKRLGLALIDLDLPIIDGAETARRLRQARPDPGVPLVGVAGFANARLSRALEEAGFGAVLASPFESFDVLEASSRALGGRGYWRGCFEGIGVFHLLSAECCQERAVELINDLAGEIGAEVAGGPGWILNLLAIQAIPEAIDAIGVALQGNNITRQVDLHLTVSAEMHARFVNRGLDERLLHTSLEAAVRSVTV